MLRAIKMKKLKFKLYHLLPAQTISWYFYLYIVHICRSTSPKLLLLFLLIGGVGWSATAGLKLLVDDLG